MLGGTEPIVGSTQSGTPCPIVPASVHASPSGDVFTRIAPPSAARSTPVPNAICTPSTSTQVGSWIPVSPVRMGASCAIECGMKPRHAARQTIRATSIALVIEPPPDEICNLDQRLCRLGHFWTLVLEGVPESRPGLVRDLNA